MAMQLNNNTSSSSLSFGKTKTTGFLNLCHAKADGTPGASIGSTGITFSDKPKDAGTVASLNADSAAAIERLVAKIKSGEIVFSWYDATSEKAPSASAF